MEKHFGFLKTTAIGGLIFLLPLIVLGALVGQVAQIVFAVAKVISGYSGYVPVNTAWGWALVVLISIALIVLVCFLSGLAARRSLGQRFTGLVEKYLLMLFPRYIIIKNQMAGSIGEDANKPQLKPIMVHMADCRRIAFEIERPSDTEVTVYLPGAPDTWSGAVAYVTADRVQSLDIEFSEAVAICETLGKDSSRILKHGK